LGTGKKGFFKKPKRDERRKKGPKGLSIREQHNSHLGTRKKKVTWFAKGKA